jgi:hypothetical protein
VASSRKGEHRLATHQRYLSFGNREISRYVSIVASKYFNRVMYGTCEDVVGGCEAGRKDAVLLRPHFVSYDHAQLLLDHSAKSLNNVIGQPIWHIQDMLVAQLPIEFSSHYPTHDVHLVLHLVILFNHTDNRSNTNTNRLTAPSKTPSTLANPCACRAL